MKYTAKNIGRKIVLKQIVLSVVVVLLLPLILVFFTNLTRENPLGYLTFYENTHSDILKNPFSFLIPAITVLITGFIIGGRIGKKILTHKNKPYESVFSGFMIIWTVFFLSCILSEIIQKAINYGVSLDSVATIFLMWILYGLLPFSVIALIYSSIMSLFISWEFEKKKRYNNK